MLAAGDASSLDVRPRSWEWLDPIHFSNERHPEGPVLHTMSNSSSATTVWLREDLADRLYARKSRGESYGDVIERLLDAAE